MRKQFIVLLTFLCAIAANAQQSIKINITDISTQKTIAAATISENKKAIAISDSTGSVNILLGNGKHILSISCTGYGDKEINISIPATDAVVAVALSSKEKALDEVVIVSSTRNNQRIENSPLKVEVLGREEMDEESTIKPASIASILGDVSGIQIQQSSAVNGNANVRIQGLDGRYTQILKDGMPLYDGFSGGFGVLSIPPLDLKQVELIKGSASTLYGGGAIGGLVNIISRRPSQKQELVLIANQTTLKETNINAYASKRYRRFGYTLFTGYTYQQAVDVNDDGFSDVPKVHSFVVHPRLFFYPSSNTTIIAGYTGTFEQRTGGDMQVIRKNADLIHQFFEKNTTGRHSGELLLEQKLSSGKKIEVKGSLSSFNRGIESNTHYFKGNQLNYFTEVSLFVPYNGNALVAGLNVLGDRFKKLPSDPVVLKDISNNTIGAFVQNTWQVRENTIIEAGIRDDYQNRYGNFFLPRLSFFQRFNKHWATRLGAGMGYKTPDALAPQTKDYDIDQLQPISSNVEAEKSIGYNAEVNYKHTWHDNEFFINLAFFLTHVRKPIIATEQLNGDVIFSNASNPVITKGIDAYVQTRISEWEVYFGYTFTVAERKYLQQNQFVPYTPRHRAAFTLVKEFPETWRAGIEASYNGRQYRDDASKTPGYLFMAGLVQKDLGSHVSLILNCENILDYRQSRKEALYSGTISNPVFKTLWAPIDGRVINLAVKFRL